MALNSFTQTSSAFRRLLVIPAATSGSWVWSTLLHTYVSTIYNSLSRN